MKKKNQSQNKISLWVASCCLSFRATLSNMVAPAWMWLLTTYKMASSNGHIL